MGSLRISHMNVAIFAALLFVAGGPGDANSLSTATARLEKTAAAYKIQIVPAKSEFQVRREWGEISAKAAGNTEVTDYAALFVQEFSLYPAGLVERCKLKKVVLCQELVFNGRPAGGLPEYETNTIYLNIALASNIQYWPDLRRAIHHEFFHINDNSNNLLCQDERWSSLNPKGVKYGDGGWSAVYRDDTLAMTDKYPGFLNHYSTTDAREDKAEVFSKLVVDPAHVEGRIKKDAVLRAKVNLMKERLAGSCPDMDDKFWEKLKQVKR